MHNECLEERLSIVEGGMKTLRTIHLKNIFRMIADLDAKLTIIHERLQHMERRNIEQGYRGNSPIQTDISAIELIVAQSRALLTGVRGNSHPDIEEARLRGINSPIDFDPDKELMAHLKAIRASLAGPCLSSGPELAPTPGPEASAPPVG